MPSTLSTSGGVSSVRPAESVIENVRPVKHEPFDTIVNAPPLWSTGEPSSVTAVGKLSAMLYGGVPPNT